MSQYTDDSMKDDDQWSEGAEISNVMKEDLYSVAQINVFLDETKGKKVEVSDFFPGFGQVYSICHVGKEA